MSRSRVGKEKAGRRAMTIGRVSYVSDDADGSIVRTNGRGLTDDADGSRRNRETRRRSPHAAFAGG